MRGFCYKARLLRGAVTRFCLIACLALACGRVEPAPEDLDGVARWFFRNAHQAPDDQVLEAVAKLDAAIEGPALAKALQLQLAPLTEDEALTVEAARGDLSQAFGIVAADLIECGFARVEELIISLDQKSLFGGYEKYLRVYTSDDAAYRARRAPFLTWTVDYTVSAVGVSYDATILSEVRFIPAAKGRGPAFVQRSWLKSPGVFNNPDDFFRQDYQLHVFYPRAEREVIKVTAVWRDMRFAGFEGSVLGDITLNGIVDFNRKLEEHCDK